MVSEVEIANMALGNIRAGTISSFTESSVEANQCNLRYSILRDRLLTEIPWGFNRKLRALSLLTTEVFNWNYAYQYPSDCLKIQRLVASYEELNNVDTSTISRIRDEDLVDLSQLRASVPYEVFNFSDNRVIGANEADLRVDYSAKITDANLFSNDFTLALTHLLAAELAIPIVGIEQGRALRSDSLQIYKEYLNSAIVNSLNEQYVEPVESEFITVRR